MVLDANGLRDVQIETVRGSLTDHYDPRGRVLRLSETVCNVNSIAAVSVACHEAGHALQHAQNYVPLKIRNGIVPVVNLASNLCWPLAIIGIILLGNGSYIGDTLFNIAVIAMLAVILFHAVTLPVEFNASRRALQQMEELGIVDDMELPGAKGASRRGNDLCGGAGDRDRQPAASARDKRKQRLMDIDRKTAFAVLLDVEKTKHSRILR